MTRWEYDMVNVTNHESYNTTRDELNVLGRQGWEVVAVTPGGSLVLKRPLADAVPGEDPSGPVSLMESWVDPSDPRPVANN